MCGVVHRQPGSEMVLWGHWMHRPVTWQYRNQVIVPAVHVKSVTCMWNRSMRMWNQFVIAIPQVKNWDCDELENTKPIVKTSGDFFNIRKTLFPLCFFFYSSRETNEGWIALMHVTSWSESYPLRNSLMGVHGFRQVFVQSFHLSAFVLKRPALLALARQSQEMRFFSPPKTTYVGRLFEGETQALNEEVTLACRWGLRRWRKANLQIVKRYVKVCSSSQSSFFDATTIEEVMATWLLSEEVFESNRHFDDRQSWESVQEFTQACTTEWRAFRRSVQEWIICGVQNQVKSWTALSTCRGSDYISTKDELQLLCWWTVQWTLVWTFPPLCECYLHMYFTNVSTWVCN